MSTSDDTVPEDLSVPDDLADLFAAERQRSVAEPLGADFAARLHARVIATTGPLPGGNDGGEGGGGAPAPVPGASIAPAAALGGTAAMFGGGSASTVAGLKLAVAAALFAAGGVTGVVVDRVVIAPDRGSPAASAPSARSPEARASAARIPAAPAGSDPIPKAEPSAASSASAVGAEAAGPEEPEAVRDRGRIPSASSGLPSSLPPSVSSPSSAAPGTDRDVDLDSERALLERARAALGRGDAGGALDALSQHASRFPRARMGEEREALWIQALVASGRRDEARARFERFRARNPRSLLVPALEATLGP